ncbi:hypothetical protein ASG43_06730 [Aureimonas sp. Leaf454]|uniref:DUF58 domain-containing protein n=1 Tax=Aureimonas sp. Leaf454 TaxID=1736381 RepID=UPI0006F42ECE|nr:DUF58 domain-containing protein [Aureimonas sp. Leaf454]KQT50938.1 hypothetical protein ASG43_06730 [Aureimonas sp. Leaf454]
MSAALQGTDGTSLSTDHLLGIRHLVGTGEPGANARTMMLPGGIVTRRRGRGLETDDIRPFAYGDDIRHIDRNTTARTGELHVRSFRDERERSVLLVADFRPAMLFGTRRAFRSVAAAEALTLAGWRIAGQGGRVGVFARAGSETFFHRPGSGDRSMKAVAGRLAAAHAAALAMRGTEDPPLSDILESAARTLPHDGTLLLASALDRPGEDFDAVVRDLVHRAALDVFLTVDAFERAPVPGTYPYLSSGGRKASGEVKDSRIAADIDARTRRIERLGGRALVLDASLETLSLAGLIEIFDARRR